MEMRTFAYEGEGGFLFDSCTYAVNSFFGNCEILHVHFRAQKKTKIISFPEAWFSFLW